MGRGRIALFVALALGYAAVGFAVGRYLIRSVIGVDPIDHLPLPGLAIQAVGFVVALVFVVGGSLWLLRFLELDKM